MIYRWCEQCLHAERLHTDDWGCEYEEWTGRRCDCAGFGAPMESASGASAEPDDVTPPARKATT